MNSKYCTVQINGEPFHSVKNMSVKKMLIYLDIDTTFSLIEYNNEILDDDQLHRTLLKQNDKLEIISIVGGG
jgi:sulfur carrier protein